MQALANHPLEHIHVNEKVFVAIKEGEKVVSAAEVGLSDGENFQEALEALQYFLQIFSRVKPDSNKKEVAQRMMDHMGSWLDEGYPRGMGGSMGRGGAGGGEGSGGGPGSGGGGSGSSNPFAEVVAGFLALKNNLSSLGQSDQLNDVQLSMDDLLKRLVLLGEGRGMSAGENSGSAAMAGTGPEQEEALFDIDPVTSALESGKLDVFWEPGLENKTAEKLALFQSPEKIETFESLWDGLWHQILSGNEKVQALCLRQLKPPAMAHDSPPPPIGGFLQPAPIPGGAPVSGPLFRRLGLAPGLAVRPVGQPELGGTGRDGHTIETIVRNIAAAFRETGPSRAGYA